MFDDDSLLGTFLNIAVLGGMYWLGTNNGKNKAIQQMEEHYRDEEIQKLRQEIEDLRSNKT